MRIFNFLSLVFFTFSVAPDLNAFSVSGEQSKSPSKYISISDTVKDNQVLFNGRVWRNLYSKIMEDQFLYSKDFLMASVTIEGETFKEVPLRYDIFNDEIMTPTNKGLIIQLNKEKVDSFSICFQNSIIRFTKIQGDSLKELKGYVNVLYTGKSALYVKFKKEIELLAVENKYNMFFQTQKIYFVKDYIVYHVSRKREFLKLLNDHKEQVRSFIKKNGLTVSRNNPESFIPVIRYYDALRQ